MLVVIRKQDRPKHPIAHRKIVRGDITSSTGNGPQSEMWQTDLNATCKRLRAIEVLMIGMSHEIFVGCPLQTLDMIWTCSTSMPCASANGSHRSKHSKFDTVDAWLRLHEEGELQMCHEPTTLETRLCMSEVPKNTSTAFYVSHAKRIHHNKYDFEHVGHDGSHGDAVHVKTNALIIYELEYNKALASGQGIRIEHVTRNQTGRVDQRRIFL